MGREVSAPFAMACMNICVVGALVGCLITADYYG
jgi:hypothetical protein